jgi:dTDP-glucose 4,6-dehydratase
MECIREGIPVPLYGDGGQVREWIWVEDNVRIIFDLMISDIGIWNIGSGDRYTNKEILKCIGELVGNPVKFNNVPDRLGHDKRYGLNCKKLHTLMGKDLTTINLIEYLQTELL